MGNGKCHNENARCRYMLTGHSQKKNTVPVKTMFSFHSLFQYADFPVIFFSAGMERHACDIFHCVFRLEAFQVLLCLPQFVDMFPECLRQIIHHIFRHIPAGEHNHFNRCGTDVPVLIRIGTRLDGITCIPGVFCFQFFHELIIDIYQACAAG